MKVRNTLWSSEVKTPRCLLINEISHDVIVLYNGEFWIFTPLLITFSNVSEEGSASVFRVTELVQVDKVMRCKKLCFSTRRLKGYNQHTFPSHHLNIHSKQLSHLEEGGSIFLRNIEIFIQCAVKKHNR